MNEKIKLMSHLVAGYPTDEYALTAARALMSPLKKSPKWTNLQIPPESLEFEKW